MLSISRITAFLRWVLSSEQLPAAPDENQGVSLGAQRCAPWLLGAEELVGGHTAKPHETQQQRFLSQLLSPERLPAMPDEPRGTARRSKHFWSWISGTEELAQQEVTRQEVTESQPAEQARFLRRLFSGEVCPRDPVRVIERRRGFLKWVLSPEECPQVQAPVGQRREEFWRWLLSGEEL